MMMRSLPTSTPSAHCLVETQRPLQPSEPLKVPEPLRPEAWPELTTVTPL